MKKSELKQLIKEEITKILNENIDVSIFDRMMTKYRIPKDSERYKSALKSLEDTIANGIKLKSIVYFSGDILPAPKKKLPSRVYNKYTPKGQGTSPNENYKNEMMVWKKEHVYPYFSAFGFEKADINNAWVEWMKFAK
jgi:hypothetical protein